MKNFDVNLLTRLLLILKTAKLNKSLKGLIAADAVEEYYPLWRKDFFLFASKYSLDKDEIADVYQDAMIVVIENINRGKLTQLSSSLKTYLFAVGKNIILNKLRESQRLTRINFVESNEMFDSKYFSLVENDTYESGEMINEIGRAIELLGDKCREILYYYYYQKLSIKSIVEKLGYANENTVKANKSRCLKTLREKISMEEK